VLKTSWVVVTVITAAAWTVFTGRAAKTSDATNAVITAILSRDAQANRNCLLNMADPIPLFSFKNNKYPGRVLYYDPLYLNCQQKGIRTTCECQE
jgi:hypothetical protein